MIALERPKVKKISKLSFILLISTLTLATFAQDEGTWRARVGVSQNSFTTLWSGGDVKANFQSLNTGATYIAPSGWFFDGVLKTSGKTTWNSVELTNAEGALNDGHDNDYSRTDTTITVGKAFEGGYQVFGGYQNSASKLTLPNAWVTNYGSQSSEKFNVSGYFVGVGKTFAVGSGSLNLNVAIGQMTGKLTDSVGQDHTSSGGTGTSFGATYTYLFDKHLGLSVEVKEQQYKYTFGASNIILTSGKDQMTLYGANLFYQF